jgi:serine/threonine protein kinase
MRRAEVMAQGPQAAAYAPPASPPPVGGAHPLYAGGGLAPTPPPQPVYAPPPQPAYPPAPAAYAQPGAWGAPAPTTRGVPPAPGPFADTGPLGASSRAAAPQGFAPPPPPAPARSSGERAPAARSAPVAPPPPAAPRDTHGVEPSPIEGYQIFDRLGEGSMGTVYSARSLDTGEVCVLKTIKFDGSSKDAIFFIREAQTGTKLKHPSIVRVLDFGEAGGILFLAMEFVGGGSLLDRIKRQGPLTNREAHAHLAAMADALEYAGKKKFVHRDIKPANILLTTEGEPKLADFGLAKMMAESGAMALTKVGETRGTPIYMPPELLSNAADADGRADIYSLGATYYHALTGFHPFRANSVIEILRMVVEVDPQPIEERNPRVHPSLIQVIRRCMRKKKEERFQNAAELIAELQRIAPEIA